MLTSFSNGENSQQGTKMFLRKAESVWKIEGWLWKNERGDINSWYGLQVRRNFWMLQNDFLEWKEAMKTIPSFFPGPNMVCVER